jgi:hypothetical protein
VDGDCRSVLLFCVLIETRVKIVSDAINLNVFMAVIIVQNKALLVAYKLRSTNYAGNLM